MVLGKLAAHGLQSLVALLAITPVFFLPVLLGGVTSAETVRILLALTVTLAVSLAIGMLVSARARHSHSAVLATFTSVAFLALIPWLAGALFHGLHGLTRLSPICVVAAAFDSRYQTRAGASCYWGGLALLVLITAGAIAVARHRLLRDRRSLEEGDTLPPARWPSATHLPRPASRRHGRRFRHPYGVRLVRTFVPARAFRLFCAVALVVLTGAILLSLVRTFRAPYIVTSMCTAYAIHIAVKLAVAFSAARQLHEDRASGALELVLTTPAADRQFWTECLSHSGRRSGDRSRCWRPSISRSRFSSMVAPGRAPWAPGTCKHSPPSSFGGLLASLADLNALGSLAAWQALHAPTAAAAATRAMALALLPCWAAILLALPTSRARSGGEMATLLWTYYIGSILYQRLLVRFARGRVQGNLRELICATGSGTESRPAPASPAPSPATP